MIRRDNGKISLLGWIVLILALVSFITVLYTSYQDRRQTQCQADVNQAFFAITKARAAIADGDRDAVRELVDGLVNAKTEKENAMVLAEYESANARLDAARSKLTYPSETEVCN